MSLLDKAKKRAEGRRSPRLCSVGELPDDLRAEVEDAIAQCDGKTLALTDVAAELEHEHGVRIRAQTLGRHRAGECCRGAR